MIANLTVPASIRNLDKYIIDCEICELKVRNENIYRYEYMPYECKHQVLGLGYLHYNKI